jgi:hypothetical protein
MKLTVDIKLQEIADKKDPPDIINAANYVHDYDDFFEEQFEDLAKMICSAKRGQKFFIIDCDEYEAVFVGTRDEVLETLNGLGDLD